MDAVELAFAGIARQAQLIAAGEVSSRELVDLYLERIGRLDGALNMTVQSVCADARVGHGGLPSDPLVQAMVVTELGAGDPVPLTSADCARLDGG